MNEANDFYEDLQTRRQAALNKQAGANGDDMGDAASTTTNGSGNGEDRRGTGATTTTDGTPSLAETDVNLTPNG